MILSPEPGTEIRKDWRQDVPLRIRRLANGQVVAGPHRDAERGIDGNPYTPQEPSSVILYKATVVLHIDKRIVGYNAIYVPKHPLW